MIIIENMLSMQTKKLSSGQMFWVLEKTSNTGKYVIKWNLFKKKHHFLV